jgi:hypothetical protein
MPFVFISKDRFGFENRVGLPLKTVYWNLSSPLACSFPHAWGHGSFNKIWQHVSQQFCARIINSDLSRTSFEYFIHG